MIHFKTDDGATVASLTDLLLQEVRSIRPSLPATWALGRRYRDDLGLDSLDLVELVARLEQATGIYVPDPDLAKLTSVATTLDYIAARLAEAQSGADPVPVTVA